MVYFTRPFTFRPAKGVLRDLEANWLGSTVQGSSGSKMTKSYDAPRDMRPREMRRISAGLVDMRRISAGRSSFLVW